MINVVIYNKYRMSKVTQPSGQGGQAYQPQFQGFNPSEAVSNVYNKQNSGCFEVLSAGFGSQINSESMMESDIQNCSIDLSSTSMGCSWTMGTNSSALFLEVSGENDSNNLSSDQIDHTGSSIEPKEEITSEVDKVIESCVKVLSEETESPAMFTPRKGHAPENRFYYSEPRYSWKEGFTMPYGYYYAAQKTNYSFTIEIDNIDADGRTTVMVRNIPNKYSEKLLIQLFEKNHKKKFDFFYLPIDTKSNCNVGYAFINFLHTKFIKDFYDQFHEQKWPLFHSEKICQICYARIQGACQLVHYVEHSAPSSRRRDRFAQYK